MNYTNHSIKAKQKSLSSHRRRMGTKVLTIFFRVFIIAIIFGIVGGISLGVGAIKGIIDTAPEITLNDVTPSEYKTTIYDCNGIPVETLVASGANRIYVTIDEIPENLKNAFIAIEDERFYEHNGIDAKAIFRAAYIGITNNFNFSQGGSTITQQLIKNSVFAVENEDSLGDRVKRKIQEQYLALKLEKDLNNKAIILENYLNTINVSNNNLGVQSASINYFNKDVSELTLSECAVIAATTQLPETYNPVRFPHKNAERRKLVLDSMLRLEMITQSEYDEAIADNVYERIMNNNSSTSSNAYSYYNDALVQKIMEDLMTQKGYTYTQAYNAVYRGGLSIHSCEDSTIQKLMEDTANDESLWNGYTFYSLTYRIQLKQEDNKTITYSENSLNKYLEKKYGENAPTIFKTREEGDKYIAEFRDYIVNETGGTIINNSEIITYTMQPQLSMTLIENGTGHVKAILGGRGDKTKSLILNRATSTYRMPGSTFKPLIDYAPAIDIAGYNPGNVLDDAPYFYHNGQKVKNWDSLYKGYVSLRFALMESRNVPALKLLETVGVNTGLDYAQKFGISTLTPNDYYLPVALGTCNVTNFEMTAAYSTFANQGEYVEPKLYTKVYDHNGNLLLDNTATNSRRIIKKSTAFLVSSMLHTVTTDYESIKALDLTDQYYSCKTGTTQKDTDRWLIGYSHKYTLGAWCGFDDSRPVPGYNSVDYLKMWARIMKTIHKDMPYVEPDIPNSVVTATICADSGLLAVDGLCDCDPRGSRVVEEYFVKGTEPTTACNVHMKVTICEESELIAGENCPGNLKKTVIKIYKPNPSYAIEEYITEDLEFAVMDHDLANTCQHNNNSPDEEPDIDHDSEETEEEVHED